MTANVLEHRRARAFAEALEAHRTGRPADREGVDQLLDTAGALAALPAPSLDTEVRAVQRAQLMAAFEQTMAGGLPAVPHQRRHRGERVSGRRRWGRRFAITGLVAGVTVGGFAGVATASAAALPGDTLYGMKRGLEGLRLDLATSRAEQGALLLKQASTRLAEAQALVGRSGPELSPVTVERLNSALTDMHAEGAKGRDLLRSVYRANGSLDPMRKLAAFTEGQDEHWAALQGALPPQLTPVAGQVDQLFGDINQDVAPLHLAPAQSGPGNGHPAGPAPGTAAPSAGQQSGTPASGSQPGGPAGGSPSGTVGDGRPSAGAGAEPGAGTAAGGQQGQRSGTGAGAPAGGGVGGPVGGLVNGLTGNGLTGSLTGNGAGTGAGAGTGNTSPAPSGTPQGAASGAPASGGPAEGSPSTDPASPAAGGQGLNLNSLLPGLLPGVGLNGS